MKGGDVLTGSGQLLPGVLQRVELPYSRAYAVIVRLLPGLPHATGGYEIVLGKAGEEVEWGPGMEAV